MPAAITDSVTIGTTGHCLEAKKAFHNIVISHQDYFRMWWRSLLAVILTWKRIVDFTTYTTLYIQISKLALLFHYKPLNHYQRLKQHIIGSEKRERHSQRSVSQQRTNPWQANGDTAQNDQTVLTALGPPHPPRISNVSLSITICGRKMGRSARKHILEGRTWEGNKTNYISVGLQQVASKAKWIYSCKPSHVLFLVSISVADRSTVQS